MTEPMSDERLMDLGMIFGLAPLKTSDLESLRPGGRELLLEVRRLRTQLDAAEAACEEMANEIKERRKWQGHRWVRIVNAIRAWRAQRGGDGDGE